MKSRYTAFNRTTFVAAAIAHLLAWAAFGWLLLWPHSYRGVSATPINVGGEGTAEREVIHYSASFVETNGWAALLPMFVPVVITGLALIALCLWTGGRRGIALIVVGLAVALLAFCGLGYLSFGVLYSPAALALAAAAIAVGFGRRSAGSTGG